MLRIVRLASFPSPVAVGLRGMAFYFGYRQNRLEVEGCLTEHGRDEYLYVYRILPIIPVGSNKFWKRDTKRGEEKVQSSFLHGNCGRDLWSYHDRGTGDRPQPGRYVCENASQGPGL